MSKPIVIHWFRNDLRLCDNPSLMQACREARVLPLFIYDPKRAGGGGGAGGAGVHAMGAASKVWLHHALKSLDDSLGGKLVLEQGDPLQVLMRLVRKHDIEKVFWNRCFEPWQIERDIAIKADLESNGIQVISSNAFLLWQPWEVLKVDQTPYRVFTPFYRKGCLGAKEPREPLSRPQLELFQPEETGATLEQLSLLPKTPWNRQLEQYWDISEKGAIDRLELFCRRGFITIKRGEIFPL